MRHPRLKKLCAYAHVLKIECDRILRHSCCPQCAIEIYRTWVPFRDRCLAPAIRGQEDPDLVDFERLLHLIDHVRHRADGIDRSKPGINGWLIEGLFVRYPDNWPAIAMALAQSPAVVPTQPQHAPPMMEPEEPFPMSEPKGAQ